MDTLIIVALMIAVPLIALNIYALITNEGKGNTGDKKDREKNEKLNAFIKNSHKPN